MKEHYHDKKYDCMVGVKLTQKQDRKLNLVAIRSGVSKSQLIREFIDKL